jgi:stress-induced morphogen
VVDESDGCGSKFSIELESAVFAGKPVLARHRLVNDALREEMPLIHAISIKRAVAPS